MVRAITSAAVCDVAVMVKFVRLLTLNKPNQLSSCLVTYKERILVYLFAQWHTQRALALDGFLVSYPPKRP